MSKMLIILEDGSLKEAMILPKKCGNCKHWMTQQCPREQNKHLKLVLALNSCNDIPCDLWEKDSPYKNDIIQ